MWYIYVFCKVLCLQVCTSVFLMHACAYTQINKTFCNITAIGFDVFTILVNTGNCMASEASL